MVRNQKGFSLVELVITMALLAMVSLAVSGFLSTGSRTYVNTNREIQVQKEAQLSINQMTDIIIDVEKGVQYDEGSVELTQGATSATVVKRELRLYNQKNNKSYMLRFYGASDAIENEKENCIYLLEGVDVGTGGVIDIQFTGEEYLLAQYVEDFSVDLSQLEKRCVELFVKYTMDSRTYETKETVKIRNDIATSTALSEIYDGEPVQIVWIESITLNGEDTIAVGMTNSYTATLVGEAEAINLGVVWTLTREDGTAAASTISVDKFSCNLAASADDLGHKLLLTAMSVSDNTRKAIRPIEVLSAPPTPSPTPEVTSTPEPTEEPPQAPPPVVEKEAPTAEIYVKEWGYTGSKDYPHYAVLQIIPHANDNQMHIESIKWNVNYGYASTPVVTESGYECTVKYGRDYNGEYYVSADVKWSLMEDVTKTNQVLLRMKPEWENRTVKTFYVDRGSTITLASTNGRWHTWEMNDLTNMFVLNDADKDTFTISTASKVKVGAVSNASLHQQYECEVLQKEWYFFHQYYQNTEAIYTVIIPKAELVLDKYYLNCGKNSSTEQILMDIVGVKDDYETYKVEIVNTKEGSGTQIRDFGGGNDKKFKIFIGKNETQPVIYVKVTASYQGTDFTAMVAVEVND